MALFENFDKYKDTLKISLGAEGELDKQQKIFSESWEAASKRQKAAWEGFYDDMLNENVFIKFTDILTGLVHLLDTVMKGLGGIPGILLLISRYLIQIRGVRIEESLQNTWRWFYLAFGGAQEEAAKTKTALMELANTPAYQMLSEENQRYFESLKRTNEFQILYAKASKNMTDADRTEIETKKMLIDVLEKEALALKEAQVAALGELSKTRGYNNKKLSQENVDYIKEETQAIIERNQAYTTLRHVGGETSTNMLGLLGANVKNFGKSLTDLKDTNQYKQAIENIVKSFEEGSISGKVFTDVIKELEVAKSDDLGKMGEYRLTAAQLKEEYEQGAVSAETYSKALQLLYTHMNELNAPAAKQIAIDVVLAQAQKENANVTRDMVETQTQYADAIKIVMNAIKGYIPVAENFANVDKRVQEEHDALIKKMQTQMKPNSGFTQITSSLMSAGIGISMFANSMDEVIEAFKTGEFSIQTFTTAIMGLTFIVPSVVNAFGAIAAGHTAQAVAASAAASATDKLAASEAKAAAAGGWITLIVTAIGLLIVFAQKMGLFESKMKKATKAAEEFKEAADEVKSLNDELSTTKDRINELQKKGSLSLVEAQELAKLKRENKELERKIKLLEKEAELKRKDAIEAAEKAISKSEKQMSKGQGQADLGWTGLTYDISNNAAMNAVNNIKATQAFLKEKGDTLSSEELKKWEKRIKTNQQTIIDEQKKYQDILDGLTGDSEEEKALRVKINAYLKQLDEGLYSPEEIVVNNAKDLQDIFDEFKIDPKNIENFSNLSSDVIEKLKEQGFTEDDLTGKTDKLTKALALLKKQENETGKSAAKTGDELVEAMTPAFEAMDHAKSAMDSLAKSGKVNLGSIKSLIKAFNEAGVSTGQYEDKLYQSSRNAKEFSAALSQMVGDMVQQIYTTNGATEETKKYVEQMLEEYGVANAAKVAQQEYQKALALTETETAIASQKGAELKQTLDSLAQKYGTSKEALLAYYIQQKIVNNSSLDLSQQIAALQQLGVFANQAAASLYGVGSAFSFLTEGKIAGVFNGRVGFDESYLDWINRYDPKTMANQIYSYYDPNTKTRKQATGAEIQALLGESYQKLSQAELQKRLKELGLDTSTVKIKGEGKSSGSSGDKDPATIDKEAIADLKESFEWGLITWDQYQRGVEEIIARGNLSIKEKLSARKDIFEEGQNELDWLFEHGKISAQEYSDTMAEYLSKTYLKPQWADEAIQSSWKAFDTEAEKEIGLIRDEITKRTVPGAEDFNQDLYDLNRIIEWQKKRRDAYLEVGDVENANKWEKELISTQKESLEVYKNQLSELKKKRDAEVISDEEYVTAVKNLLNSGVFDKDWEEKLGLRNEIFEITSNELEELYKADKISAQEYSDGMQQLEENMGQFTSAQSLEAKTKVWEAYDKEAEKRVSDLARERSKREKLRQNDINQDIYDLGKEAAEYWARYESYMAVGQIDEANEMYDKWLDKQGEIYSKAESEMKYFYDEWKDQQNEIIEQIKAQKSIWSGYYETYNSLLEAQHDIDKELQKSLTSMQYLDEESRKLLFNTEDYAALTKEINSLQKKTTKLRDDYLKNVEGKTKEEVSLITAEYERQNKLLQKQYDIAKKQLEVDKARMKLNNVLNERNTRMFIAGQWQWVADANAIIEAQEALADAEYESQKAILEKDQQMYLDTFDKAVDGITEKLNTMAQDWEKMEKKLAGHMQNIDDVFAQLPGTMQEAMQGWADALGVTINKETPSKTKSTGTKTKSIDYSVDYAQKALDAASRGDAAGAASAIADRAIKTLMTNGAVDVAGQQKLQQQVSSLLQKKKNKNASGTSHAIAGLSSVNERGLELLGRNGQLIELQGGDKIFSNPQMDFLYRFSRNPASTLRNMATTSSVDNSIVINGFTVDGNSTEGEQLRTILMRVIGNR